MCLSGFLGFKIFFFSTSAFFFCCSKYFPYPSFNLTTSNLILTPFLPFNSGSKSTNSSPSSLPSCSCTYLLHTINSILSSTSLAFWPLLHIAASTPLQWRHVKLKHTVVANTFEKAAVVFSDGAFSSIQYGLIRTFTVSEHSLIRWLFSVNSPCNITASRD